MVGAVDSQPPLGEGHRPFAESGRRAGAGVSPESGASSVCGTWGSVAV
ncbi:hypothetical protein BTZ20_2766 [Rhodococcus sp. MTM3W5.2]|nr:hypothetical protein BTZ20_2766 [Rhodococcus sp. MTM3W5.2]